MRSPIRFMGVVGVVLLLGAGCFYLDEQNQVKDLRILAMKIEPPELLYSFLHVIPPTDRGALPLGPYPITAQVLAVDPQGRTVEVATRLCPEDKADGCPGYVIRETAPADEIVAVTPLVQPDIVQRKADLSLGGELAVPSFAATVKERALDYMLPHDADGNFDLFGALLFSSWPSFVVRARIPGGNEEEVAFKRFLLSLDVSPRGLPPEVTGFIEGLFQEVLGLSFCEEDVDLDADVQCIKPRVANRNPAIERVLYRLGSNLEAWEDPTDVTSDGQLRDLVGRVKVRPSSTVRIRPVVGADDHESYQGFNFDLQTKTIGLKNFHEDMAFSFFTTVGLIAQTSGEQYTPTPDTIWEISPDAPDGPANVWVIVRDQRGGIDWRRLDFEVTSVLDDVNAAAQGALVPQGAR